MIGTGALFFALGIASADGCATPREAMSLWLGPAPAAAVPCAVVPDDMSEVGAGAALVDLRRVIDARGVMLSPTDAPDNPDHKDARTQEPRFVPVQSLPELELVKTTTGWRFSSSTLRNARRLHDETFVVDLARLAGRLPPWASMSLFSVAVWQMLAVIVLVLIGAVLRVVVSAVAIAQVRRLMKRFDMHWSDSVLIPATAPLGLLVWAGVVAIWLPVVGLPAGLSAILMVAVRLVAASSVVLVAYRLVDVLAESLAERAEKTHTKLDDQLVPLIRRALKIAIIAIGSVFVLQNLHIDVASLVAGLGLGGLAFALAAKDTISHLFGSVTIFVDRPFQIGDRIVACDVDGTVEEVGFRTTRVRTLYDSLVSIPNGKLTDAIIDNYGRRQFRRTMCTLNLTYATTTDQLEAFCAGVRGILAAHPATRKDNFEVHFSGFGAHSLDVLVYFFVLVPSWSAELRARHEIYLDIMRLAERLGVDFAFPTQTLHVDTVSTPRDIGIAAPPKTDALVAAVKAFGPGGSAVVAPGPRLEPHHLPGAQ